MYFLGRSRELPFPTFLSPMRRHEPSSIEWSESFSSIATFVTSLPPLSTAPVSVAAAAAAVSWNTVKDVLEEGSSWPSGGAVSIGTLRLDCKQGGVSVSVLMQI